MSEESVIRLIEMSRSMVYHGLKRQIEPDDSLDRRGQLLSSLLLLGSVLTAVEVHLGCCH